MRCGDSVKDRSYIVLYLDRWYCTVLYQRHMYTVLVDRTGRKEGYRSVVSYVAPCLMWPTAVLLFGTEGREGCPRRGKFNLTLHFDWAGHYITIHYNTYTLHIFHYIHYTYI